MNILIWHVHGSWLTSFVQGPHTYLVPVTPDRGPDGLGRARTWTWPASAVERTPEELRDSEIDLVVLQRPHEIELTHAWTGRRPGRDVPAVYVEHNSPHDTPVDTVHPVAGRTDIPLVHVTHFNRLMWDNGRAPTSVVEHGIIDPGQLWTGTEPRAAVVVNEPVRRGRTTGTDLLPHLARAAPLHVFGMGTEGLARHLDLPPELCRTSELPQSGLHPAMARCRVYLHPVRWTSLGLSLLEAMFLGMPVVALGTTEVREAVPPDAGVVSNRPDVLDDALRHFLADAAYAERTGNRARAAARARYGVQRFLDDWERLMKEVTR
ncbi:MULTISPECIES: glycosyltransferase [unclassified Streptomyces]|uniref:glycosyltransferase n=1 Tax=unclassified Streptomyces TaxID=2593676 RepID=UPI0001C1A26A|nr:MULTISPECIES: glycosyltransferase [unclassified Streptomyces]AEN13816.1 glycosyl transferase group 1 [Streptomyces sp. SirexAA-E]MYR67125.1 glycosyltransferase [Streptomyces sp. SID4939]MYR99998.1 glycosyltransferase [Streptomyces sp. SID4940]MYT67705.1 glycosyltransferase [Streptomyces sp. SID8357]MYT86549.1 glycosyltransferase [Streptomyces sp. SID8360]